MPTALTRLTRRLRARHRRVLLGTGGRVVGRWFAGATLLVPETPSRLTGRRRATPQRAVPVVLLRLGPKAVGPVAAAAAAGRPAVARGAVA